jgi:hypothetical protein
MDLGALNSGPSVPLYRSQADTLKSLDTSTCSVLSSCCTSTHNNLFTGDLFQNEAYVSVEESTTDRVSLNHFLAQVITKIEREFLSLFSSVRPSLARLSITWRLLMSLQLNGSLAPRLNITTQPTNVAHT